MIFYFTTLIVSVFLAYSSEQCRKNKQSDFWPIFLLCAFLVFLSGFRYEAYLYSDEWIYRKGCEALIGVPLEISGSEWLFHVISWCCANLSRNSDFFIFFTALVTNVSLILFWRKYSYSFGIAVFLYVGVGGFSTSWNIIRQYLALAIVVWCYPLAINKKFLPYLILTFLAASIHQSAWIFLPLYIIFSKNKPTVYGMLIIVFTLVSLIWFSSIATEILVYTKYESYAEHILGDGYGMNYIRFLAWLVPFGLLWLHRKQLAEKYNVKYAYIYAVLLSICVLAVSTQYVYVARFMFYFIVPAYTLMGLVSEVAVPEKIRKVFTLAMIFCFMLLGLYQVSMGSVKYHNIIFEGKNIDLRKDRHQ